MSIVFVTNIPAPYREKIHEIVSRNLDRPYSVVFCAPIEPNRKWRFPFGDYNHIFLTSKAIQIKGRQIYLWSNILNVLKMEDPSTVVIGGFSMPMLIAYCWAKFKGRKTIAFSDAHLEFEKPFSKLHKALRKLAYPRMDAYVGASLKTLDLFRHYGAADDKLFQSHLCADNEVYSRNYVPPSQRNYDIILCGQFVKGKLFDFSLRVIERMIEKKKDLTVKLVGDGPLRSEILSKIESLGVKYTYRGFIEPTKLSPEYSSARILFFPTVRDAWGVVANEACAAGTPVLTCEHAGVAHELIKDNINGFVLPLDEDVWAKNALELLTSTDALDKFSDNALDQVKAYNYDNAASGIIAAINRSTRDLN
ncbi:glycosyltransferase family 4 protein [Pseudomonas sp. BN414]|uniref:glycosyltransferase family 4 protein n=1 Tax=Pseudomonas sp. BN414 TaxID=2567888 RepID=UPI0024566E95|nr:glycosyltransferase family 4 protein [Pseudomonas sp. BN414]MDH4568437.1 glycosyltransferase family 4 protein [Pseudomonas sp. BN414]